MKNKQHYIILLQFIMITILKAQPSFPNSPNQAPIGGLGLLAAAGGAMAVKKLLNKRKK